jgi:adenylosuccinate lyase
MIDRYQTPLMKHIWSDENRINLWKQIESHVVYYYECMDEQSHETSKEILDLEVTKDQISEEEKITKHELLSFINVLNKNLKSKNKKYLHRGLTSSDVLDTAFSIQLKQSAIAIKEAIIDMLASLKEKANDNKSVIIQGRTHGMHAELTTFGLVLTSFYSEWLRHFDTINELIEHVSYGKISGPIGNYTIVSPELEDIVLMKLGLKTESVSTQIIPRDRYAKFFVNLAVMAGSIERFATEFRLLSQSGIDEINEGFSSGQKGSSAMPHKRNPIQCENLCGISRIIKSNCISSLENISLWHERDMSHSSVERFIGPDVTTLLHYSILKMNSILKNMNVHSKKMNDNIDPLQLYASHHLLDHMVFDLNYSRDEAHNIIQNLSNECYNEKSNLVQRFKEKIDSKFDFNINKYFSKVGFIMKRVFNYVR